MPIAPLDAGIHGTDQHASFFAFHFLGTAGKHGVYPSYVGEDRVPPNMALGYKLKD